jgi:hypothetical protein
MKLMNKPKLLNNAKPANYNALFEEQAIMQPQFMMIISPATKFTAGNTNNNAIHLLISSLLLAHIDVKCSPL